MFVLLIWNYTFFQDYDYDLLLVRWLFNNTL
jgi:hypothetical protein